MNWGLTTACTCTRKKLPAVGQQCDLLAEAVQHHAGQPRGEPQLYVLLRTAEHPEHLFGVLRHVEAVECRLAQPGLFQNGQIRLLSTR